MSKHTPGPWRMVRVGDTLTIAGAVPGYFAEIRGACEAAHGAMGEANARLIAAAPDLLVALQDLQRWASGAGPNMPGPGPAKSRAEVTRRAAEAVAKATGGDL